MTRCWSHVEVPLGRMSSWWRIRRRFPRAALVIGMLLAWWIGLAQGAGRTRADESTDRNERSVSTGSRPRAVSLASRARLVDVLRYGELRNGEYEAVRHEWEAALARVPQARALDTPMLMLGYEFAADPFARRTMPLEMPKWTTDRAILGFTWMLPGFGKRAARQQRALAEAMVAAERLHKARFELRRQLVDAYAELYMARRMYELESQNQELLSQLRDIAAHQYHAGLDMPATDVAKLDVEIARSASRKVGFTLQADRAQANLNGLLNRRAREPIGELDCARTALATTSAARLLEIGTRQNPQLRELAREVEAKGAGVVLAELERRPDFQINLSDIRTLSQMVMIGLTLPIFNRQRIEAQIREAVAEREAALARLRNAQADIPARITIGLVMLADAERILRDFRGEIEKKVREVLDLQQRYYGSGNGDLLAVLDTQRMLIDVREVIIRAEADRLRAMGEVEAAVGYELLTERRGAVEASSAGSSHKTSPSSRPTSDTNAMVPSLRHSDTSATTVTNSAPALSRSADHGSTETDSTEKSPR